MKNDGAPIFTCSAFRTALNHGNLPRPSHTTIPTNGSLQVQRRGNCGRVGSKPGTRFPRGQRHALTQPNEAQHTALKQQDIVLITWTGLCALHCFQRSHHLSWCHVVVLIICQSCRKNIQVRVEGRTKSIIMQACHPWDERTVV